MTSGQQLIDIGVKDVVYGTCRAISMGSKANSIRLNQTMQSLYVVEYFADRTPGMQTGDEGSRRILA
jgi:hypothetical protein